MKNKGIIITVLLCVIVSGIITTKYEVESSSSSYLRIFTYFDFADGKEIYSVESVSYSIGEDNHLISVCGTYNYQSLPQSCQSISVIINYSGHMKTSSFEGGSISLEGEKVAMFRAIRENKYRAEFEADQIKMSQGSFTVKLEFKIKRLDEEAEILIESMIDGCQNRHFYAVSLELPEEWMIVRCYCIDQMCDAIIDENRITFKNGDGTYLIYAKELEIRSGPRKGVEIKE